METKAHHVLIGAFVLIGLLLGAVFAVWLSRLQLDQQWDRYRIYFFGSVTGLSKASEVRYNGVPVGAVTDIQIDPADPRRVLVLIEARSGTPVKEDSTASLELQGITGIAYVAIAGGSAASPPLRQVHVGGGFPVIPSKASGIQEIVATAPELLNRAMTLLAEGAKIVSEDNLRAVARILANLERTSGAAADRSGSLIDELERTSAEFRRAAGSAAKALDQVAAETTEALSGLRGTAGKVDKLVEGDLRHLIGEARTTTAALAKTSDEIRSLVTDTKAPVGDFAKEGLHDFARLVVEMRQLVGGLARLADQLESDAPQLIFGERAKGQVAK